MCHKLDLKSVGKEIQTQLFNIALMSKSLIGGNILKHVLMSKSYGKYKFQVFIETNLGEFYLSRRLSTCMLNQTTNAKIWKVTTWKTETCQI